MDSRLKDIKVCIWDFDRTLYPPNEALYKEVRNAEIQTIIDYRRWSRDLAETEFNKLYLKKFPGATETVAAICNISTKEAAVYGEQYINRAKYLQKDEQLVQLFHALHQYRHFMLVNGTKEVTAQSLIILGLSPHIFEEIVTSELVGANKPSDKGYLYILEKTRLPPAQHLMIGDREMVDLKTAKKLGMKTCLVWATEGTIADWVVPTVYDLVELLSP
ncbi:HAD family hydrolase [Candidatus Gottesmanbacteria bacterium]|nr:HAD family hydrolase [Candidatus Gottesmanbacteria bacterium]